MNCEGSPTQRLTFRPTTAHLALYPHSPAGAGKCDVEKGERKVSSTQEVVLSGCQEKVPAIVHAVHVVIAVGRRRASDECNFGSRQLSLSINPSGVNRLDRHELASRAAHARISGYAP